jgi:nucleotide-binding universal stress UspA family protein
MFRPVANAGAAAARHHPPGMSAHVIVSYDGTANDEDALALGGLLAAAGATLALAYVRHARDWDPDREAIAQHDAEHLLELGALALADRDVARHVVVDPSTPHGLEQLAGREQASLIVFGSEYRTSPGRAEPGTSAQTLLEGGSIAVAVAAAGLRADRQAGLRRIATAGQDAAAAQTAQALARALDAVLVAPGEPADLVVVGSPPGAAAGRIALGGAARGSLNATRGSVLVLPAERPLDF